MLILKSDTKQIIDTNKMTIQQLRDNGLDDMADWIDKWNALPESFKTSALGEFFKKIANRLGGDIK
jgi:hypothetical protein